MFTRSICCVMGHSQQYWGHVSKDKIRTAALSFSLVFNLPSRGKR